MLQPQLKVIERVICVGCMQYSPFSRRCGKKQYNSENDGLIDRDIRGGIQSRSDFCTRIEQSYSKPFYVSFSLIPYRQSDRYDPARHLSTSTDIFFSTATSTSAKQRKERGGRKGENRTRVLSQPASKPAKSSIGNYLVLGATGTKQALSVEVHRASVFPVASCTQYNPLCLGSLVLILRHSIAISYIPYPGG